MLHKGYVGSLQARSLKLRAHIHTVMYMGCPPDGFCIVVDTIAYAKVSDEDSFAWRTQLHLTMANVYTEGVT